MTSSTKVVRKRLADGSIREYRYPRAAKPSPPSYSPDSLDALLAAYRRSQEWSGLAKQTRAVYSVYLRNLDKIGHLKARDLRRRLLLDIRDAIAKARGNGAATGFIRSTSALMAWAVDREWIDHHPLLRVKALPSGHLPAWSEEDAARALAALDEPFRRVVVLGLHTGQRRGDLIALTWNAYDGSTIRLRQSKTGAPLILPVHPTLKAELDAWKETRKAAVILTSPQNRAWTAPHLTREMGKRLAALGLPGLNIHGLRKLAAARLADAGASVHEIAAITGHASLSMVALYTRSADQHRLALSAVRRLETGNHLRETKPAKS